MYRIGIDIGGTNLKAGIVDENNHIIEQTYTPVRRGTSPNEIISDACQLAENAMSLALISKGEIAGAGISCAGTCDIKKGRVIHAYNLGFVNVPICDLVNFRLGVPVKLANDADAAALAEVKAGSASGSENAVYICIGTGIGVGVIINGKIYSGCGYAGTEAGHMTLKLDGEPCTCTADGCFEAYASATALINQAERAAEADPASALNAAEKISARTVFEAADAGDAAAMRVTAEYIRYLSAGITSLVNIFDPEAVVIGGGVSRRGEKLLVPVREYVGKHIFGAADRTPPVIAAARFSDGVLGAAMLINA